ncbi:MAG: class I mannose-6-phosphate isomerase [Spirochaetes bacterium]|nr:class I mannose-6-phosphate isomerase [Spirochaetota bacterium]
MLYPLKFKPIFKEKIWGGDNLLKCLDKNIEKKSKIGESWEISDRDDDSSVIINGELRGETLTDVLKKYGRKLIGSKPEDQFLKRFPLLIKFIDANDKLSVQVHPNDKYASKHEKGEFGKTEMWYIVHAKPGAYLISGLKTGTTKQQFKKLLEKNDLEGVLNKVKVKTGDVIFIPAGRVHAIMPGIVINEIQQNSDITYRVYDWGRRGFDGKARPLHVSKALDVINFDDFSPQTARLHFTQVGTNVMSILARCLYFQVEKYILNEKMKFISDQSSFNIFSVVDGNAVLNWETKELVMNKGETILIPAEITSFAIYPQPVVTLIRTTV